MSSNHKEELGGKSPEESHWGVADASFPCHHLRTIACLTLPFRCLPGWVTGHNGQGGERKTPGGIMGPAEGTGSSNSWPTPTADLGPGLHFSQMLKGHGWAGDRFSELWGDLWFSLMWLNHLPLFYLQGIHPPSYTSNLSS